jgi:translation initiation factor 2 subunit 3
VAEHAPVIPVSAQVGYNIDAVIDYLARVPIPDRNLNANPFMIIIRSFDINHPGEEADQIKGGVAGGTIL